MTAAIDQTRSTFGRLDILVNNVARAGGGDLLDTSDAEWQAAFDETLFPAIRASRLAVPHMKAQGGGSIVMIASIYGREAGGDRGPDSPARPRDQRHLARESQIHCPPPARTG